MFIQTRTAHKMVTVCHSIDSRWGSFETLQAHTQCRRFTLEQWTVDRLYRLSIRLTWQ